MSRIGKWANYPPADVPATDAKGKFGERGGMGVNAGAKYITKYITWRAQDTALSADHWYRHLTRMTACFDTFVK